LEQPHGARHERIDDDAHRLSRPSRLFKDRAVLGFGASAMTGGPTLQSLYDLAASATGGVSLL